MGPYAADFAAVQTAVTRIRGGVAPTPTLTSAALSARAGRTIRFKCESFQRTGSFKLRGALNAVMALTDEEAARGLVTHSAGNFGQALALAARIRGVPATVVMPETAPAVKQAATRGYGARVITCPPTVAGRVAAAETVVQQTGATFISSANHPDVIAGQGTIALEVLQACPNVQAIVAPVGGGGLVSGIAVATAGQAPGVAVYAAEPAIADDTSRSLRAGAIQPSAYADTIADGLRVGLGPLTWPIVRDQVHTVITVTEDEIRQAMRLIWARLKVVIEPSSAVAYAAVCTPAFATACQAKEVAVILSGGNTDLDTLPWLIP